MIHKKLVIRDLRTTFGTGDREIRAVQGIDLEIGAGETYVLLGESGSGKSVTARSILRLYDQSVTIGGQVMLDGEDISEYSAARMRRVRGRRIAMVPQDPTGALDPLRSIGHQLLEVLRVHGETTSRRAARDRARELLSTVGIADPERVLASRPHQLSGGMRQRAVIAIAIACRPEVLIADEPTTALDVTVQAAVIELFIDLQKELGMALLMVTHDVGVAEELGGQVGVMYAGRLVETGSVEDVLREARHPYTRGLLASLPVPGVPRGQLAVIAGRPPLTGEVTTGCAFAARCPLAQASCSTDTPALIPITATRSAACPVTNDVEEFEELRVLEMTA